MKKKKVIILMGGKSPEHEISLISGTSVVKNLNEKKYVILPVVISKSGDRWSLTNKRALLKLASPLPLKGTDKEITLSESKSIQGVNSLSGRGLDVVFIAMHGPFGEDGTVQGMLELAGIPYTGAGVLASAVGMDKIAFRKIMQSENLPVPKYAVVRHGENFKNVHKVLKRPPYFVKPYNQGSSVGASIVKKEKDLGKALKLAHRYAELALVDEYLKGTELTCAVLGNSKPFALPVIEIVSKNEFFDYESKYTESGADEIVPARIPKAITKKIQDIAIKVYKTLRCKGFARVDFILRKNEEPMILEINTIPGLTPMSLLPKAAKAAGISYPALLDRVISYALEK